MGIFDPQATVGVQPMAAPQAVAPAPSGIGAVGALLGSVLGGIQNAQQYAASNAPSASQITKAEDQARMVGFTDGLMEVQQLREQGLNAEANRMQQQLMINATRDGFDISSDEARAAFESITGQSSKYMSLNLDQQLVAAQMETPEFRSAYMATYATLPADATEDQRVQAAFESAAMAGASSQAVLSDNFNYNAGGREAIDVVIGGFNSAIVGTLEVLASQSGTIPISALNDAELNWNQTKQLILSKRGNVSSESWAHTQAQLDGIDAQFKLFAQIAEATGDRGMTAQMAQGLNAYVNELVADGDLNIIQGNAFLKMMSDPAVVQGLDVLTSTRIKELATAAEVPEGFNVRNIANYGDPLTDEREQNDPGNPDNIFDKDMLDSARSGETKEDGLELVNQSRTIAGETLPMIQGRMEDAGMRDSAISLLTKGFTNMYASAEHGYLSNEALNATFNGTVVQMVDEIAKYNPAAAEALSEQAYYALDAQRGAQMTAVLDRAQDLEFLSYDEENNAFVIDSAAILRTDIQPEMFDELVGLSEEFYGGDLSALIHDGGQRFTSLGGKYSNIMLTGSIGTIKGMMEHDFRITEELNGMVSTIRNVEVKMGHFQSRMGEIAEDDPYATTTADTTTTASQAEANIEPIVNGVIAQEHGLDFGKYESTYNLPAGYLERTAQIESGGDASAQNPNTSAGGLFQFVDATAKQYGLTDKFDPKQSAEAAARLASDNAKSFSRALGREPTGGELYLLHQQGAGGGIALLRGGDRNVVEVLTSVYGSEDKARKAVVQNGGRTNMTASEFASIWTSKYDNTIPSESLGGGTITPANESPAQEATKPVGKEEIIGLIADAAAPQLPGSTTATAVPGADGGMTLDANIELGVPMDVVEAAKEQKARSEQDTSGPDLKPYKSLSESNLSAQRQRIIRNQLSYMGVARADRDVPVFEDVDAAMDAIIEGIIQMGDVIVIGDQVRVIEDQSGGN